MGYTWGHSPRLSQDQQRHAVWLAIALAATLALAAWWGGHKQQSWLDHQCRHGIATACARAGR